MINLSDYSCDKCAREFSRHCKHCLHTAEKPPTRFKKKKKTGIQTPEYRRPTAPPQANVPPMPSVKPAKEKENKTMYGLNPITMQCTYSTPCGWCTKCDKKIGCGDDKPQRGLRANTSILDDYGGSELDDIRSGKGLSRLDTNLDPNKPLPGIRKEN